MSRKSAKGPRLWLQPERRDKQTGKITEHAVYLIRDGKLKRSTGCGPADFAEAQTKLATYIAEKHNPEKQNSTDPRSVLIADIINLYLRDVAPGHARPAETAQRCEHILDWWSDPKRARADLQREKIGGAFDGVVSDIRGATCRCFARQCSTLSWARRILEDLRSAVNYAFDEGLIERPVSVTLPEKSPPRDRNLTRSEVAKLVWAAWRFKAQPGARQQTRRATRKHIARALLVGVYTGTRKSAIGIAAFERRPGCGFVDLENGVWYRKPTGQRQTKKRQPPARLPKRLLSHMRRWRKNGQTFLVEFNGEAVGDFYKALVQIACDCGIEGVTPHVLRHTAATWAMQKGGDPWKTAGYLGMSVQTLLDNYGHHRPDHLDGAGDVVTRSPAETFTPTAPRQVMQNKA